MHYTNKEKIFSDTRSCRAAQNKNIFVQISRREASGSQHFQNKTSLKRETNYNHEKNRWGRQVLKRLLIGRPLR